MNTQKRTRRVKELIAEAIANFAKAAMRRNHQRYYCAGDYCICAKIMCGNIAWDIIKKDAERILYNRGSYATVEAKGLSGQLSICLMREIKELTPELMALFLPTNTDELIFIASSGHRVYGSLKVGETPVVLFEDYGPEVGMWDDVDDFAEVQCNADIPTYATNVLKSYSDASSYGDRVDALLAIVSNDDAFNDFVEDRQFEALDEANNLNLCPCPHEVKIETVFPPLVRDPSDEVTQIFQRPEVPMFPSLPLRPRPLRPDDSPQYDPEAPDFLNDGANM